MNKVEFIPSFTVVPGETQTFNDAPTIMYPLSDTLRGMTVVEDSGVLDFWTDPREDVYSDD